MNGEYLDTVKDGKLPGCGEQIRVLLRDLEGKRVKVTIKEMKNKRSLAQNRYWFAMLEKYVQPVYREYGHNWSSYDIHQSLMHELGYEKVAFTPSGKPFLLRQNSSDLTAQEWEVFMEQARAHLAEHVGIVLPLPNEELEDA